MSKSCIKLISGIIVVIILTSSSFAGLTSVTNHNSNDSGDVYLLSTGDMADGELIRIDRTATFASLPAELVGADYILTANDDKTATDLSIDVTFDTPMTLYLSVYNSVGDLDTSDAPIIGADYHSWMANQGWEQTAMTWGPDYTVYKKVIAGTSYRFFRQYDATLGSGGNFYSIAAKEYSNTVSVTQPFTYAAIDIGRQGHIYQRVEPGFTSTQGNAPAGDDANRTYELTSTAISTCAVGVVDASFDLSITSVYYQVSWIDRGNSSSSDSLVRLGEDFVEDYQGALMLTLGRLPEGKYTMTSYHLDSADDRSPRIQVYVSDAAGNNRMQPVQGDAGQELANDINNITTATMTNSAISFNFYSDGTNDITVRYQATPGKTENSLKRRMPLNGFTMELDQMLKMSTKKPTFSDFALFDFGLTGQRVESGAIEISKDSSNGTFPNTTVTSDTGVDFTIAVDNIGTNGIATARGIEGRDRGDSTSTESLVKLGEDFFKNNNDIVRVILGDLPQGNYRVESFHLDSDWAQSSYIKVFVTDANGSNVEQSVTGDAFWNTAVNDLTTYKVQETGTAFYINANGTDDVIITFDGSGAITDKETPLNGLRIQTYTAPIHEPLGTMIIIK